MPAVRLEPAHSLLENFTVAELLRLAAASGLERPPRQRPALVRAITRHLALDEIVALLPDFFGATSGHDDFRLDRLSRGHGPVTVQVGSPRRPALGHFLLGIDERCLQLSFVNIPLVLENRWPVIASDAGFLPRVRLYAGFSRPGQLHPAAEAPPPRSRPFIIDEGNWQIRDARLRLELERSGPVSFTITFLRHRPPALRPEYLLEPIV